MPLEIREALLEDAATLGRLLLELGYDEDEAVLRRRLERVVSQMSHIVLVATEAPHGIVGMAHAAVAVNLLERPYLELGALVVATAHRRNGVARSLLERVHGWALRRGIDDVEIAVPRHRKGALQFLTRMGYTLLEERRVHRRNLGRRPHKTGERTAMD